MSNPPPYNAPSGHVQITSISWGAIVWPVFWALWLWFISLIVTSVVLSTLVFLFASLFGLALLGST